jgi:hypothetical protein
VPPERVLLGYWSLLIGVASERRSILRKRSQPNHVQGTYTVRAPHVAKAFDIAERKAVAAGYEPTGATINLRTGDFTLLFERPSPAPVAPNGGNSTNIK